MPDSLTLQQDDKPPWVGIPSSLFDGVIVIASALVIFQAPAGFEFLGMDRLGKPIYIAVIVGAVCGSLFSRWRESRRRGWESKQEPDWFAKYRTDNATRLLKLEESHAEKEGLIAQQVAPSDARMVAVDQVIAATQSAIISIPKDSPFQLTGVDLAELRKESKTLADELEAFWEAQFQTKLKSVADYNPALFYAGAKDYHDQQTENIYLTKYRDRVVALLHKLAVAGIANPDLYTSLQVPSITGIHKIVRGLRQAARDHSLDDSAQ